MDLKFVTIILTLIFLECILSLDNAAVMGAMVAHLPLDINTPWPEWLQSIGAYLNYLLGPQREAALRVGLFGAYAGRLIMLALATWIIEYPWVQIIGALYLLYLGVSHFAERHRQAQEQEIAGEAAIARRRGFWGVVIALNLADLAFSLDNVVAAVALSDVLWIVALGVGIGMLAMRFAATLFTKLMSWEPALEHAAYLLLFAIGGELIADKWFEIQIGELARFSISIAIILLVIIFARVPLLRRFRGVFHPFMVLFALIYDLISSITGLLLLPFRRHDQKAG